MRYLIVYHGWRNDPFYTNVFEYDNNWEEGMMVFDLFKHKWTNNGVDWMDVELDQF